MTLSLFVEGLTPDILHFEGLARQQGHKSVAGIDEAGRGPLAGPVVAAAVILPCGLHLPGVTDSKKLSAARRQELYGLILGRAFSVGVGEAAVQEIDELNVLQATLLAMERALAVLEPKPDFLLIDGITPLPVTIPQRTIAKGDSLSLSVAAASIVAKVTRDRQMMEWDERYPGYGFARHKGYGTRDHLAAIARLGPCPIHRLTFRGVREHVGVVHG
jgi:ribonuclease HII